MRTNPARFICTVLACILYYKFKIRKNEYNLVKFRLVLKLRRYWRKNIFFTYFSKRNFLLEKFISASRKTNTFFKIDSKLRFSGELFWVFSITSSPRAGGAYEKCSKENNERKNRSFGGCYDYSVSENSCVLDGGSLLASTF